MDNSYDSDDSEIEYICVVIKDEPFEIETQSLVHSYTSETSANAKANALGNQCQLVGPVAFCPSVCEAERLISPPVFLLDPPGSLDKLLNANDDALSQAIQTMAPFDSIEPADANNSKQVLVDLTDDIAKPSQPILKRTFENNNVKKTSSKIKTKPIRLNTDCQLIDPRIGFYGSKLKNQLKKLLVILHAYNLQQNTYNQIRHKTTTSSTKSLDEEKMMHKHIEFVLNNDLIKFDTTSMSSVIDLLSIIKLIFEDLVLLQKKTGVDISHIKLIYDYLTRIKLFFNTYLQKYFAGPNLPKLVSDILKPIKIYAFADPDQPIIVSKLNDPRLCKNTYSISQIDNSSSSAVCKPACKDSTHNPKPNEILKNIKQEVHEPSFTSIKDNAISFANKHKQEHEKEKCSEKLLNTLNEMLKDSTKNIENNLRLSLTIATVDKPISDNPNSIINLLKHNMNDEKKSKHKRKKSSSSNNSTTDNQSDESFYKKPRHTSNPRARSRTLKAADQSRVRNKSSYSLSLSTRDQFGEHKSRHNQRKHNNNHVIVPLRSPESRYFNCNFHRDP
jgi:hypothetical protein